MSPIDLIRISENELIQNNNTGIEYEYAICYLLQDDDTKRYFLEKVINNHPKREIILDLINNINISELIDLFNHNQIAISSAIPFTQDDDIGPSDIIILGNNGEILGLSIKYENNCSLNFSSKLFFNEETLHDINERKDIACDNYINEMRELYGNSDIWFRQRKRSIVVDNFIDEIRGRVIFIWENLNGDRKSEILQKLVHGNSPIQFWIVKVRKNLNIDVEIYPVQEWDPTYVNFRKHKSSNIRLFIYDAPIGDIQVKFNNGIIERGTATNHDYLIDDIYMKNGQPLSSWNFSLLFDK